MWLFHLEHRHTCVQIPGLGEGEASWHHLSLLPDPWSHVTKPCPLYHAFSTMTDHAPLSPSFLKFLLLFSQRNEKSSLSQPNRSGMEAQSLNSITWAAEGGLEFVVIFSFIASLRTAWTISGSFQQNLASVCNGVIIWRLIMGWNPGCGSLNMVHPFVSAPNFVSVTPSMGDCFQF